jgi:hypothetical protein
MILGGGMENQTEHSMASTLPFPDQTLQICDRSFDAETTALIGQAFDQTCRELHDKSQPASVKEIIAQRIIEIAGRGERDPDRISEAVLKCLGLRRNVAGRFIG